MSELIHIALAFDEAYARHGGATIASVMANVAPGEQIFAHVLDNGISCASREFLKTQVKSAGSKIEFIQLDLQRFSSFPTTYHSAAAYSRLALPDLLPSLRQVIYLDSDVIVRHSLRPLWETSLHGRAAAVVRDAADIYGSYYLKHKQKLGLRLDQAAFNSGVMVMNLETWREKSLATAAALWISKNAGLMIHSDQDALNAILKDQVSFLNPVWNVQAGLIRAVRYGWINHPEWVAAVRDPAIIHYTTDAKPWNFSYAVPRRRDYNHFAKLSAIENQFKKTPTLAILFQRMGAEAMEFRYWLAALAKGRLRSVR